MLDSPLTPCYTGSQAKILKYNRKNKRCPSHGISTLTASCQCLTLKGKEWLKSAKFGQVAEEIPTLITSGNDVQLHYESVISSVTKWALNKYLQNA